MSGCDARLGPLECDKVLGHRGQHHTQGPGFKAVWTAKGSAAHRFDTQRCPYCNCVLALDDRARPIPHDHIDDTPSSLEDRPRADY